MQRTHAHEAPTLFVDPGDQNAAPFRAHQPGVIADLLPARVELRHQRGLDRITRTGVVVEMRFGSMSRNAASGVLQFGCCSPAGWHGRSLRSATRELFQPRENRTIAT